MDLILNYLFYKSGISFLKATARFISREARRRIDAARPSKDAENALTPSASIKLIEAFFYSFIDPTGNRSPLGNVRDRCFCAARFAVFRAVLRPCLYGDAVYTLNTRREAAAVAVRGEEWALFGFLMNCLCLLTPAAMTGFRVSAPRAALSALFFALLSVLQSMGPPILTCPPIVLLTPLLIALCAFGRRGMLPMGLYTLLAGFLFSGLCAFCTARGLPAWSLAPLCAAAAVLLCRSIRRARTAPKELCLFVTLQGEAHRMRAIVDTGNRLSDGRGSVVIVPRALLPLRDERLSAFADRGLCLLSARTISGRTLLPAFWPDKLELIRGGRRIALRRARIALSPDGERALLPPGLI